MLRRASPEPGASATAPRLEPEQGLLEPRVEPDVVEEDVVHARSVLVDLAFEHDPLARVEAVDLALLPAALRVGEDHLGGRVRSGARGQDGLGAGEDRALAQLPVEDA